MGHSIFYLHPPAPLPPRDGRMEIKCLILKIKSLILENKSLILEIKHSFKKPRHFATNPRHFARTPFFHEQEEMEHFDWSIARQSIVITDFCQKWMFISYETSGSRLDQI